MHALVCRNYGPPAALAFMAMPAPAPGPADVTVRLVACGLSYPDLLEIAGQYQVKLPLPFVPGREGAGVVAACGRDVRGVKVGDRVIVTALGCYAEEITVDTSAVISLPDGVDMITAAAFPVAHGTAYHALVQCGRLQAGETAVIHGASGSVGLAAVQLAKHLGAHVIATGSDDEKLKVVAQHGADATLNHTQRPLKSAILEHTHGRGADVVLDTVGGDIFGESLRAMAPGGRILVTGFMSGRFATAPVNQLLVREVTVVGVNIGTWSRRNPQNFRDNLNVLSTLIGQRAIVPHIHGTAPLAEGAKALEHLAARQVIGKFVLVCGEENRGIVK